MNMELRVRILIELARHADLYTTHLTRDTMMTNFLRLDGDLEYPCSCFCDEKGNLVYLPWKWRTALERVRTRRPDLSL